SLFSSIITSVPSLRRDPLVEATELVVDHGEVVSARGDALHQTGRGVALRVVRVLSECERAIKLLRRHPRPPLEPLLDVEVLRNLARRPHHPQRKQRRRRPGPIREYPNPLVELG